MTIPAFFIRCFVYICHALLLCGCTHALKRAIEDYRGDGEIRYLKAPGPLGLSGCEIQFPDLDLSREIHATYDITGIPRGENYVVYLVVPGPYPPQEAVLQGRYRMQVIREGKIVRDYEAQLKEMTCAGLGNGENRFYFKLNDLTEQGFDVDDSNAQWSIFVSYSNPELATPVRAYVVVTRGGEK